MQQSFIKNRSEIITLLPLALVSMVALALEVHLTKLLSYSVNQMMVYLVLGLAMLGFGAAGSLIAIRAEWLEKEQILKVSAWSTVIFVISIIICYAIFVRFTTLMSTSTWAAFLVSFLLSIPFLAAGSVITLAIASAGTRLPVFYAANLVGSGLGCFIPVFLLGPLSGQQLLVLLAFLGWLAALFYLRLTRASLTSILSVTTWVSLALLVFSFVKSDATFPLQPEPPPAGQLAIIKDWAKVAGIKIDRRYDRWNATGRIEIFEFHDVPNASMNPYPFMFYAQDSTAGSTLVRWERRPTQSSQSDNLELRTNVERFCSETLYSQGYFEPRSKVMIIGLGGAPDLQCAIYFKSRTIDVAEINQDAINAVKGPFNDWLGGISDYPGLSFHNKDGRSFVHNTKGKQYDLIQLSGVDTKQNLASGGLTLSENYLYTKEAFVDYLKSLSPTGVISLIRFGEIEALRLVNTAITALREIGVADPTNHIAVFYSGVLCGVVVHRTGFSQASADALRNHFRESGKPPPMPFYYWFSFPKGFFLNLEYSPHHESNTRLASFINYIKQGNEKYFLDAYEYNIAPTVDDRPFFFDSSRYDRVTTWKTAEHIKFLTTLVTSVLVLSVLLILIPVRRMREGLKGRSAFVFPAFFASVGLAYLLVEIWMLHRFSMFLGHQIYGLSVVLSTLLLSTGLGAWLSARLVPQFTTRVLVGVTSILLLLLTGALVLPSIFEATWHLGLSVRVLIAMVFIVPTGFAMGFPFPAGLSCIYNLYPKTVPWCVGINGFASVMATIIAIPLCLGFGYVTVLETGAGLYALAALLFFMVPKQSAKS